MIVHLPETFAVFAGQWPQEVQKLIGALEFNRAYRKFEPATGSIDLAGQQVLLAAYWDEHSTLALMIVKTGLRQWGAYPISRTAESGELSRCSAGFGRGERGALMQLSEVLRQAQNYNAADVIAMLAMIARRQEAVVQRVSQSFRVV